MLQSHLCFNTKFCRSRLTSFGVRRGSQKLGYAGTPLLGWRRGLRRRNMLLSACVTVAHSVILRRKPFKRNYGNLPENFDPSRPPFKVTQGHWNRHGSIGYLWLPVSNPWELSAYLVPFSRWMTIFAKFSHPVRLTSRWWGFPRNFITAVGLRKLEWCSYH